MTEEPLTPTGQPPVVPPTQPTVPPEQSVVPPSKPGTLPTQPSPGSRAGVVWTFTVVAVVVLIFLVVFMVQNQDRVTVNFLGFQGQLALGIAMLIASVAGALVVAIAGAVRIIQLRARARTAAKRLAKSGN